MRSRRWRRRRGFYIGRVSRLAPRRKLSVGISIRRRVPVARQPAVASGAFGGRRDFSVADTTLAAHRVRRNRRWHHQRIVRSISLARRRRRRVGRRWRRKDRRAAARSESCQRGRCAGSARCCQRHLQARRSAARWPHHTLQIVRREIVLSVPLTSFHTIPFAVVESGRLRRSIRWLHQTAFAARSVFDSLPTDDPVSKIQTSLCQSKRLDAWINVSSRYLRDRQTRAVA